MTLAGKANWTRWLARRDLLFIGAVILAGLALYGILLLTQAVIPGGAGTLDETILRALRNAHDLSDPLGPRWFEEVMRDVTALGGTGVLTIITLAVTGFLLITGKRHAAVSVLAAVITGTVLSHTLKWSFGRPRPDFLPHGAEVYTASFPSGHSMLSAVAYLTLAVLLARTQPDRRVKIYLVAVAIVLTVLVGVSRVYLGVHWPTDVLAGWLAGIAWAILCWSILDRLQRRGYAPVDGDTES